MPDAASLVQMKRCTQCRELKPLSDFHKDQAKRQGVNSRCKACYNSARRANGNNPGRARANQCVAEGCHEKPVIYRRCEVHAKEFKRTGADISPPQRPSSRKGRSPVRDDYGRKRCGHCGRWLPESAFGLDPRNSDGMRSTCRDCHNHACRKTRAKYPSEARDYRRRKQHGLTDAEFDALLDGQGGRCAGCGTASPKRWVIDHDHASGCPETRHSCDRCRRGILCDRCNTALGLLADDPEVLTALAAYLRRYQT